MKKTQVMISFLYIFLYFFMACEEPLQDEFPRKYNEGRAGLTDMPFFNPPKTAVHIDPENSSDPSRDGSAEHPFISFREVEWEEGRVYALKRGTTLNTNRTVMLFADNVTLASYGEGDRPVIKSSTEDHAVSTGWEGGSGITIRDIEVHAPGAQSCLIFRDNSRNVKCINCKLHGAAWGLRALNNVQDLYIHNTEIFNTLDDGIFIKNSYDIEISNCYVHDVNKNWSPPFTPEEEAGGDGIQLSLCNKWHVHHNLIDRTDSGNKFCFISNNPEQNDGIFEFNQLRGPLINGSSVYLHDGHGIVIRYNRIEGPSNSPFYSHGSNMKVYGNLFIEINGPLFSGGSALVFNNLFYHCRMGIEGENVVARNNIFDLGSISRKKFRVNDLTESNNLFVLGPPTDNSFVGKPLFRDPQNGDFHLLPGSECIDRGTDVGLKYDRDGTVIPSGKAPDIGPYEFVSP